MAMSYEFERHISASRELKNERGVAALKALQTQYEILALAGIVPILPKEKISGVPVRIPLGRQLKEHVVFGDVDLESLSLGELLHYFIHQAGLTQKQLGEEAHITYFHFHLSKIENGHYLPHQGTLNNIVRVLGWDDGDARVQLLMRKLAEAKAAEIKQIKKDILKALTSKTYSYAELERKIDTGYRSIVQNCKELESFGAVEIRRLNKHEANGKPYFQVSITNNGREVLKKF